MYLLFTVAECTDQVAAAAWRAERDSLQSELAQLRAGAASPQQQLEVELAAARQEVARLSLGLEAAEVWPGRSRLHLLTRLPERGPQFQYLGREGSLAAPEGCPQR